MPVIGLGTFQATSGDAERAVKDAIDAGYRHIDTAFLYGNEVDVGNAVRTKINEGVIKREDIFITTKVNWNQITLAAAEQFWMQILLFCGRG